MARTPLRPLSGVVLVKYSAACRGQDETSLGSVVNNFWQYFLIIKRTKRYHIKGIGSPLLISINIDIFDQETGK